MKRKSADMAPVPGPGVSAPGPMMRTMFSPLPPPKSHMPSGVSLSPKGDLGDHSAREVRAAFPRAIKNAGKGNMTGLPYRRPSIMNDYGNKGDAV